MKHRKAITRGFVCFGLLLSLTFLIYWNIQPHISERSNSADWENPRPTDCRINKEQAVEIGWKRVRALVWDNKEKKGVKEIYKVSSVDLRIIRPQMCFFIEWSKSCFSRDKSRPAWVIVYEEKVPSDTDEWMEIRIDARNGNIIGGDTLWSLPWHR